MPTDYVPRTVDGYPKFASISNEKGKANQKSWTHNIPKRMYRLVKNNIQTITTTSNVWFDSPFKTIINDASAFRPALSAWDSNCDISYSAKHKRHSRQMDRDADSFYTIT